MSKFLAIVFLFLASYATTFGNFWFTYGIWPRSWWSFVIFSTISLTLTVLYLLVREDGK